MRHLVAALAVLTAGCNRPGVQAAAVAPEGETWLTDTQLRASQVVLGKVTQSRVAETTQLAGRVGFNDLRVTHVFSPVTGRVANIFANPGDKVGKGAVLAEIDSPDVGNAMSDLLKAEADAEAAKREMLRQRDLFSVHAAPKRDVDAAENSAARADAELQRTRQKMKLFRVGSSGSGRVSQTYALRAPIAGEVLARNLNPGAEVQGQYTGSNVVELFLIGDIDEVWITADVHEMELGRIAVGQPVVARVVTYPDEKFPGLVQWMSEVLDPATHTAKVRIVVPNASHRLRPEMYATLDVTVGERMALAVPRSAIVRLGQELVVYVAQGKTPDGRSRLVRRRVKLPADVPSNGMVPVVSGLSEGEQVVEKGTILLTES